MRPAVSPNTTRDIFEPVLQGDGYLGSGRASGMRGGDGIDAIDIGAILGVFRRKLLLIVVLSFAIFFTAAPIALSLPPRYSAEATVIVGGDQRIPVNIGNDNAHGALDYDESAVQTEVEILRSSGLARQVIEQLKLDENPEFNSEIGTLEDPTGEAAGRSTYVGFFEHLAALWSPGESSAEQADALQPGSSGNGKGSKTAAKPTQDQDGSASPSMAAVVNAFSAHLSVSRVDRTRAIKIAFDASSAETAARVVNALMDQYVLQQKLASKAAYDGALSWYAKYLNSAQDRRAHSQEELTDALHRALAEGGLASADSVLGSPLIQGLKQQKAALEQRIASMQVKYGRNHPELREAQHELANPNSTIDIETKKILQQTIRNSTKSPESLDNTVALLSGTAGGRQLEPLAKEASVEDTLYSDLLRQYYQLKISDGRQNTVAKVLSYADVPLAPYFPNKKLILALVIVISLSVSFVIALMIEGLDRSVNSRHQLERLLGVKTAGLLPAVGSFEMNQYLRKCFTDTQRWSRFDEAIRNIHVRLLMGNSALPRKILVTSSVPCEGKSSTAAALAMLSAKMGTRTLIVDCDLRRPSVQAAFGVKTEVGLTDVLQGQVDLSRAICTNEVSGVDVLTAGKSVYNPGGLLASKEFTNLLARLEEFYDFVIIDSPPMRAVSDALVIPGHVDEVLFLVRWSKTRTPAVVRSFQELVAVRGGKAPCVALSLVDIDKVRRDGREDYYEYGALDYSRQRRARVQPPQPQGLM